MKATDRPCARCHAALVAKRYVDIPFIGRKRPGHERRVAKAGARITIVVIAGTMCGVCGGSLRPGERYPDPLSTTTGHEKPLHRLGQPGIGDTVLERPEHWECNQAKGRNYPIVTECSRATTIRRREGPTDSHSICESLDVPADLLGHLGRVAIGHDDRPRALREDRGRDALAEIEGLNQ